MDKKSLSSKQVRWAQKLSRYHLLIDYCLGKANGAADALFQYPQQNIEEKNAFWAENVKNLHRLQSSLFNASLSCLGTSAKLLQFYWVLIYEIYVLPQLQQFWSNI